MMSPPIERLLGHTGSKFRLVTVASTRARQINAYFGQLGEGLGAMVPPQVTSLARKPLSIAFEEIDAGKIVGVDRVVPEELFDTTAEAVDVPVAARVAVAVEDVAPAAAGESEPDAGS
ncbi:MAG: DNA-directed RNA polymerase subunit omega [Acidimicrobiales bacterium]|nr:DNA-directed RNA polymerase subunit omega [Acidimicrobiales bacterium]